MGDDLEERLRAHDQNFQGLLSMIPAKLYYGQDNSDQWQRKKQTKEEARAAKKAKLDPDNAKTAKDVMDENARKRKREANDEGEDHAENSNAASFEQPREGMKGGPPGKKFKKAKRQSPRAARKEAKIAAAIAAGLPIPGQKTKEEKEKAKRDAKKAKADKKAEKLRKKLTRRREQKEQAAKQKAEAESAGTTNDNGESFLGEREVDAMDVSGLEEPAEVTTEALSVSTSKSNSPVFDKSDHTSGASSISSIAAPPSEVSAPTPGSTLKNISNFNSEELKSRLEQKIAALRAARKADAPEGPGVKTRQELMESRRKKEEERKAAKKILRAQAREKDRIEREEAMNRGSPLMSPAIMSPGVGRSPLHETNSFAFGRIAFENGQTMTANLNAVLDPHKRKGAQDPRTALAAAEKRAARISGLDEEKRADIEEKDIWLNAKKRAHGERIRDDTSLLKKTLKRKEKAKSKSTKEWDERKEGVAKSQAIRQKKREENLQKRRDEKGSKGKKSKSGGVKKGKKVKPRAGFEGSFKAKSRN